MHASLHHSANTRNQVHRRRDANDAGRSPDDIDHVLGAATCTDGVPMSVESTNRYGNSRFQPKLFCPVRGKATRNFVRGGVLALKFLSNTFQQRINFNEKFFGRKTAQVWV